MLPAELAAADWADAEINAFAVGQGPAAARAVASPQAIGFGGHMGVAGNGNNAGLAGIVASHAGAEFAVCDLAEVIGGLAVLDVDRASIAAMIGGAAKGEISQAQLGTLDAVRERRGKGSRDG